MITKLHKTTRLRILTTFYSPLERIQSLALTVNRHNFSTGTAAAPAGGTKPVDIKPPEPPKRTYGNLKDSDRVLLIYMVNLIGVLRVPNVEEIGTERVIF